MLGTPARQSDEVAEWLASARAGSDEALGRVLDACRNYLLLVGNAELDSELRVKAGASDLVQETFLEAQRGFERFRGTTEAELRAWLRRILMNNLGDLRRRYRDADKRRLAREVPLELSDSSSGANQLPAGGASPSAVAAQQEELERVERAIEQLPADHRQVILLRNRLDASFAEIGQLMGRSEDAARTLWYRAVRKLSEILACNADDSRSPTAF
jgi:RNA polymerase sigma-70 factor (ECF subfamily)